MRWVVFLRAVNVGGANRCQPALIAKELAKFGVVNIGAVGTFVVRENVSESVLRAAIAKKLPFKCERSEEHTSGTPVTPSNLVCRLLLEKKKKKSETLVIQSNLIFNNMNEKNEKK